LIPADQVAEDFVSARALGLFLVPAVRFPSGEAVGRDVVADRKAFRPRQEGERSRDLGEIEEENNIGPEISRGYFKWLD
jgi:hypothetical protein